MIHFAMISPRIIHYMFIYIGILLLHSRRQNIMTPIPPLKWIVMRRDE